MLQRGSTRTSRPATTSSSARNVGNAPMPMPRRWASREKNMSSAISRGTSLTDTRDGPSGRSGCPPGKDTPSCCSRSLGAKGVPRRAR